MKGRPLVKQGYEQELSSIKAFVSMQDKSDTSHTTSEHVRIIINSNFNRAGTDPVLLSGYPFTKTVGYPNNCSKNFMTCLH